MNHQSSLLPHLPALVSRDSVTANRLLLSFGRRRDVETRFIAGHNGALYTPGNAVVYSAVRWRESQALHFQLLLYL